MANENTNENENTNAKNNAYSQYIKNPKAYTIRRWLNQLLKEHYPPHDQITERVASALVTDKDVEDFGKLLGTTYQCGYSKAFNDYKKHAEKLGITLKLSTDQEVKSGE